MGQVIFVTAPMSPDLELKARIHAAKMRVSRAELVRLAVADYVKRLEVQTTTTKAESTCEPGLS